MLINTHLTYPNWTEGTLNNSFIQKAKAFFEEKDFKIIETTVQESYEPDKEVQKHLEADIVILQTPVNWFGTPWIYKRYVDEVFNSALHSQKFLSGDGRTRDDATKQYGTGGKMQGKKFMICATFNAPAQSFENPSESLMQGKTTTDLFLNITSNYKFCGYDILPGYNCFDIFKDGDIAKDLENYPTHLAKTLNL